MKIHNANGTAFDTKQDCLDWIESRIVRFKLRVGHAKDKKGKLIIGSMQKSDGRIIDTGIEGFKPQAYDEPLNYYAEPVPEGDKWLAVMKVSDQ